VILSVRELVAVPSLVSLGQTPNTVCRLVPPLELDRHELA